VGLERDPLSLVSTMEVHGRNSSGSGLENRQYDRGDPLRWPRDTLYPQTLASASPISAGSSVDIVRSRTKATSFFSCFVCLFPYYCLSIWCLCLFVCLFPLSCLPSYFTWFTVPSLVISSAFSNFLHRFAPLFVVYLYVFLIFFLFFFFRPTFLPCQS
jgi:hypothetical protein